MGLWYHDDHANRVFIRKLGVSPVTVSKWCRNEMQPTVESSFNIANVLKVDVRSLLVTNLKKEYNYNVTSLLNSL